MFEHKPKVIVFDIGGVLLDWKYLIPVIAEKLKITPDQFHQELRTHLEPLELGKSHQDDFWKYLCETYGYNGNFQELKKIWIEEQPIIKSGWDLLKTTKEKGYRVVCCTNNWIGTLERQIEIIPEFSLFETIINSAYEGVRKPEQEIYKIVENRVGEKEENLLLIDDLIQNCEGAKDVGWQVFQYDCLTNGGKDSKKSLVSLLEIKY